jgi:hypothetical protein
MSIQEIITIVKTDINLSNNNFFFGDYNEYNRIGNTYITLLQNTFTNHMDVKKTSITVINNNNKKYNINYIIKMNELYWTITKI